MVATKEQNQESRQFTFTITPGLEEDKIWRQQVRPLRHQNPQIRLIWLNANAEVEKMIRRAIVNGEST